ncbi:MAG: hypothetical protein WEB37_06100 [Bacteroidota bacterium]
MTADPSISEQRLWLLQLAREAGDRHFDPKTGLCLIVRDTCWYATSLLFDPSAERRNLGNSLLRSLKSNDGTHTPASMLSLLHGIPDQLEESTRDTLRSAIRSELVNAAGTEWKDGNVNHPLGAYCTLILGGELHDESWASELGLRRLRRFQQRIGDHRSKVLRQAEMSEYNSLTYTALDLTFLALIAEYARNPEARNLALFLEEALWVNAAMHYHAPSGQFAGPHSRSYFEDSFGGYSALHCALLAASGRKFSLDPALSVRFDHPSDLIQNALTAITPFHFPERAALIAWEKPFPYLFRMTTYGESYHENTRRADGTFGFDEEMYPGGWTDLTSYLTQEYALGSAATPYVNAGHADSVMLRIRRSAEIKSIADFRSAFTRGVYNGALPGIPNFCHTTSSRIDASYLAEEGRCATYQRENRLIVCYSPKRAGHKGIQSYRTDFIFTYAAPFNLIMIDGKPVSAFPFETRADARICIRDGRTYLLLIPLELFPAAGTSPLRFSVENDFFLISAYNYRGSAKDFTRNEVNGWRSGYYLEVWTEDQFGDWSEFLDHANSVTIRESVNLYTRGISVEGKDSRMELVYDPFREHIISRKWCGMEENVASFSVSAAGVQDGPFCPQTLYGSEGLDQ